MRTVKTTTSQYIRCDSVLLTDKLRTQPFSMPMMMNISDWAGAQADLS